MKTNNKFITINQARYNSCQVTKLQHLEAYKPIRLIAKIVGYTFLTYGILTSLLPSGSQIAIIIGCLCLGIDFKKVLKMMKHYTKEAYNWFYAPTIPPFINKLLNKIMRRSN